jgi:hypothetical protein
MCDHARPLRCLVEIETVTKKFILVCLALALSACSSTQITKVQKLSPSANAPYTNILVIALFESYDARVYLEKEIVSQLSERGVKAVASTSRMTPKVPANRETFLAMVDELGSDAVLVTRLVNHDADVKIKDMRPESTYNVRSTYYYNVWEVELKEYTEPQYMEFKHSIVLATQLYSASTREPVWAIESTSKIVDTFDRPGGATIIRDEAAAITSHLSRDGAL